MLGLFCVPLWMVSVPCTLQKLRAAVYQMHVPCACLPVRHDSRQHATDYKNLLSPGVSLPSFPDLVVKAKYATEHRCGIVISGPGLSDEVSGTDPWKDNLPLQVRCCCCFTHESAA